MSRTELLALTRSSAGVSDDGLIVTSRTGIIAAGAPALSTFWAFEPNYGSSILDTFPIVLERLRLQWTCITAFTTPVVAGRELALCLLDVMPSPSGSDHSNHIRKNFLAAGNAGGASVSTTAPLTIGTPPDPDFHDPVMTRQPLSGSAAPALPAA